MLAITYLLFSLAMMLLAAVAASNEDIAYTVLFIGMHVSFLISAKLESIEHRMNK